MALNHNALILKNYMVNTLVELLGIPLQANLARARNRFIVLFNNTVNEINAERMVILKKYGELDEAGELKVGTDGHYILKDKAAFDKEFEELTTRAVAIPCVGEMLTDFHMVKNILDTLETKLTVAETTVYDEIMKAFEEWAAAPKTQGTQADEGGVIAA